MARLPFDTRRTDTRPRQVDLRDWRDTPRISVSREFERELSLDEICVECINEIVENAESNEIRTFYYNMMSQNGYRNNDFEKLIRFAVDFLELRVVMREVRRIDDNFREAIRSIVALHTSKQVKDYPELLDEVPRNLERSFMTNAEKFIDICDNIERLHRGDDRDRDRGRDRDYRDQYSSNDRRDSRDRDRGRDYRDRGRDYRDRDDGQRSAREGGDSHRDRDRRDDNMPRFMPLDDDQGGSVRPVESSSERGVTNRDREERPVERKASVRGDFTADEDLTFGSPSIQSFPPAPPPPPDMETEVILTEHSLTKSNDCDVVVTDYGSFPTLTRIKESDMDMNAHSIVYPADVEQGQALIKEAQKIVALEAAVHNSDVTAEQIDSSVEASTEVKIFGTISDMVENISDAATLAMIEASGENSDGVRRITHTNAVVTSAVTGFIHLNEIQKQLRNAGSLRDVAAILRHTTKTVSENAPVSSAFASDMHAAVARIDRILTNEINLFCREGLKATTGKAIASFARNFDTLVDQFEQSAPRALNEGLLVFLSELMSSYKECMVPSLPLETLVLQDHDTDKTGMAMFPLSYTVTHLPFTLSELGVSPTGTVVLGNNDISEFIRAALQSSKKLDTDDFSFGRRLLVTRDLEVFRVFSVPGRSDALILVPLTVI